jgi:cell division protease FtsH
LNFPGDDEQQRRMRNLRNIALVIVVLIFSVILLQSFFASPDSAEKQIQYSEFLQLVQAGQVTAVTITNKGSSLATIAGTGAHIQRPGRQPAAGRTRCTDTTVSATLRESPELARGWESAEAPGSKRSPDQASPPKAATCTVQKKSGCGASLGAWPYEPSDLERSLALPSPKLRKQKAEETQRPGADRSWERQSASAPRPSSPTQLLQALIKRKCRGQLRGRRGFVVDLLRVSSRCCRSLFILVLWYGMMRRMQGEGSSALNFGRSQAKLVTKEYSRVTFDDVAGIDEVKEEVQEIVDYLKDPQKFTRIGAQIPKGVLLVGPPGTGKTLLARAIAGEADVPFFSISGSDFVEMFVGVGAARVRDLFRRAKEEAKGKRGVIIFIDEIDAVGRKRGAGIGGGHDEREQTLNQLLSEMDGFEKNEHVIILAATNRPDILDPALLRPGRFDRKITVPPPDSKGREAILKVHVRNKKLAPDVDLRVLARRTPGFVGADLENLCNEAALLAARRNKEFIDMKDFEDAIDRVIAGIERKGRLLSEEEKVKIAYHEAGHALLGKLLPKADPVHRISIVPRGEALGYTLQLPLNDKYLFTKEELLDRMTGILGGRAAEELVFGEISTGAYDDLKKATEIAKRMVVSYGMSERVGPINLGQENGNVFLGVDLVLNREHSEKMSALVDEEIKNIIESCYRRAKELLQRNLAALHKLAKRLLEVEVLEGEQLDALLKDSLVRPSPAPQPV